MGADGDKSAWRGILGRATHTDPRATVVRMPKKSFEQLAAGLQLALDDREHHISEFERLDNACRVELDRMRELIESASVRVRSEQEAIRLMLAEPGVAAKFMDDGGNDEHHAATGSNARPDQPMDR